MEPKMKALKIIPIILLTATLTYAQSVVVGTGAEINLGTGVDICSSGYGNITGNVTGTGTQCDTPMPVEMMTFSASVNKTSIILAWQTSSEINNKGFEVYRSGKNTNTDWTNVGFVNGNGTKTTPTNYTYSDNKLSAGKYYYRIKQVDFNGNFQYFNLNSFIEIAGPTKYELSQNYPNPFNPVTKINFSLSAGTTVSLKVYDIAGREVSTLINNKFLTADYYSLEFDASKLASGVYVYRIVTEKFTNVKKMVVLK
jgi:hypothetical protein